jgi:hypothetical protein
VIGGYTGSGKTETLHALQASNEPIIDLEGIAHHKGSTFGNLGQPVQPSQEQFEKIYSYYLTENNQENIYILNHLQIDFEDTNIFNNSFIFDSEERFNLLFWKNSKKYSKKTYPRILYFYLKRGILFLNIYKNVK